MSDKKIARREVLLPAAAAAATVLLPQHRVRAAERAAPNAPIFTGIMQIAYIVPDLQQAMQFYAEHLGVGPWFVTESFKPIEPHYRGQPTDPDVTIGMSYSGQMNVELIQQRDATPSVYKELEQRSGFGFHHWGVGTRDFDRDLQRYLDRGTEVAFSMTLASGIRLAYLDTTPHLPGMIELIEVDDGVVSGFTGMFSAAQAWDGKTLLAN